MSTHTPPEIQPVVVHIDDDPDLIDLTRLALQPLAVRFVGIVRSQAGLETVRFVRPALVLLDLMMPQLDGWDLLHAIRGDPALTGTKVVLYTALSDERDRARGLATGVEEYLTKPCQPARLRAVVARLTGVPETSTGSRAGTAEVPPRETAPRPLPAAAEMSSLPGAVIAFVDRYLDDTVALELVTYLHDNPELYLAVPALSRALGRKQHEIERPLAALVERGLLATYPDEHGEPAYMLNHTGAIKAEVDAFFVACDDPQVRIKALYRIIRRRTAWR